MIVLKLFELQVPFFLKTLALARELKANIVQLLYLFRVHFAIFKACTLFLDPTAKLWVKAVNERHLTYNTGREESRVSVDR
jgi:hypothetical protein